jgi:hypothetical protein
VRGSEQRFHARALNGSRPCHTGAQRLRRRPNRGRGFDFNVFASDLFSSLQVRKTASANTDEGSLGATVDLDHGKPLDYKGRKIALSAEDAYYENGGTHNPRCAVCFADQWFDDRVGASVSFAYSERDSEVDRYKRQAGQSDYRIAARAGGQRRPGTRRLCRARGTTLSAPSSRIPRHRAHHRIRPGGVRGAVSGPPISTAARSTTIVVAFRRCSTSSSRTLRRNARPDGGAPVAPTDTRESASTWSTRSSTRRAT